MAELINYSMGIRSNRVDPLLNEGQSKKSFPEARARRNSFSSKENAPSNNNNNVPAAGRKSLAADFEKTHQQQEMNPKAGTRKSNPDALKQCNQERTILGKKISTSTKNVSKGAPFYVQQQENEASVSKSSSSSIIAAENTQRFSNTASMNTDHFAKNNSVLPSQGASPKKQGLKFMAGPPEFVAEKPEPKIRHTHSVRDARGACSNIAPLVQQSTHNTPAVAPINSSTRAHNQSSRRGSSSASYNIITGQ